MAVQDLHKSEPRYTRHRITNAADEGFNSTIQTIKASARGFRSFENFRVRILFFCASSTFIQSMDHTEIHEEPSMILLAILPVCQGKPQAYRNR